MKNFGRQKRVVMKYNEGYKYVHIYDNRKVEKKYPGITLGYDEFLQLYEIIKVMMRMIILKRQAFIPVFAVTYKQNIKILELPTLF